MNDDLELLKQADYGDAVLVAQGMEGCVYRLTDATVGKIPHTSESSAMHDGTFNDALASRRFPFAVPTPLGNTVLGDGRTMQIERFLQGCPLDDFHDPTTGNLSSPVVTAIGDVLAGLRDLQLEVPLGTILDGEIYEATAANWADVLVALGRRRFEKFGDQLHARDAHVERTVENLLSFLRSRHNIEPRLIHGDLCGANILVDDHCQLTAVIDWGFFSVLAEPELDAAIASAVFDMYGPHATTTENALTDAIVKRFGLNRDVILAYKGVYALITSNVYNPEGNDGHFAWCSDMLARPNVRAAAARLASCGI